MPSLAQYLLFLAAHPRAAKRHNSSIQAAEDQMTDFDLTGDQQKVLLTGDADAIQKAANKELLDFSGGATQVTIDLAKQFITHPPPYQP